MSGGSPHVQPHPPPTPGAVSRAAGTPRPSQGCPRDRGQSWFSEVALFVQRLPAPRPWAVEGAAEAGGGRGRCWCGCEASIIPLLAGVPFLVSFFLAAEEPGYFRSPQSSRWEQPPATVGAGRGQTGLRALLQALVNGPRLPGRPDGGRPPGCADSPRLARRPFLALQQRGRRKLSSGPRTIPGSARGPPSYTLFLPL